MIAVLVIGGLLLAAGAVLALVRAERGPTMLDRTVALDTLTIILVCGVAMEAAWSRRVDTVPMLVVLALVGFVGSVTIARFASVEPEGEGRVLTREEVAALEADRLRAMDEDLTSRDEENHGGSAQGEVAR